MYSSIYAKHIPIIFIVSILYLIISIAFNIPGDEPDFYIRIIELKTQYQFFDFSDSFYFLDSILDLCQLRKMDPFQNFNDCTGTIYQFIFLKFLIGIISYLSIFIIIYVGLHSNNKSIHNIYIAALILLNLPGYPYYLSLLSPEVFFNLLSIIASLILVTKYKLLVLPLIFILFKIDFGNACVFIFFIFNYIIVFLYINKFKFEFKFLYLLIFFMIIFISINRTEIFEVFSGLLNLDYLNSISSKILTETETNKYPLYVRYITFFWTSFDLRPSGINSAPIFFIILFSWIFASIHFFTNCKFYKAEMIFYSAALMTVLLTITLLPTYSFGKYYVFIMPFLFLPIVFFYRNQNIFLISVFVNNIHLLFLYFFQTKLFYNLIK